MRNSWERNWFHFRPDVNRPFIVEDLPRQVTTFENLFITHLAPRPIWARVRESFRVLCAFWSHPINSNYSYELEGTALVGRIEGLPPAVAAQIKTKPEEMN
jgi:hypothetical protein